MCVCESALSLCVFNNLYLQKSNTHARVSRIKYVVDFIVIAMKMKYYTIVLLLNVFKLFIMTTRRA